MMDPTDIENTEFDIDDVEKHTEEQIEEFVTKNFYKIRQCVDYNTEYKECRSITGKFHQYFVHGEFLDCSFWKNSYENCEKCFEDDRRACAYVICAEEKRRQERMKAHLANDVWKKRDRPPPDWNKPLPDWAAAKTKDSYLTVTEKLNCTIQ